MAAKQHKLVMLYKGRDDPFFRNPWSMGYSDSIETLIQKSKNTSGAWSCSIRASEIVWMVIDRKTWKTVYTQHCYRKPGNEKEGRGNYNIIETQGE